METHKGIGRRNADEFVRKVDYSKMVARNLHILFRKGTQFRIVWKYFSADHTLIDSRNMVGRTYIHSTGSESFIEFPLGVRLNGWSVKRKSFQYSTIWVSRLLCNGYRRTQKIHLNNKQTKQKLGSNKTVILLEIKMFMQSIYCCRRRIYSTSFQRRHRHRYTVDWTLFARTCDKRKTVQYFSNCQIRDAETTRRSSIKFITPTQ